MGLLMPSTYSRRGSVRIKPGALGSAWWRAAPNCDAASAEVRCFSQQNFRGCVWQPGAGPAPSWDCCCRPHPQARSATAGRTLERDGFAADLWGGQRNVRRERRRRRLHQALQAGGRAASSLTLVYNSASNSPRCTCWHPPD